jgi:AraC-like DNA-binding protein
MNDSISSQDKFNEHALFLNSFSVSLADYLNRHIHNPKLGHNFESIGFLINGSVDIQSTEEHFTAQKGDVIYIPKNVTYISRWSGNPKIQFIFLNYTFISINLTMREMRTKKQLMLQKIEKVNDEIIDLFYSLYASYKQGIDNPFETLSIFYRLYSKLNDQLRHKTIINENQIMRKAMLYIEQNPHIRISVPYLSEICHMSESQFYSIFKSETGYSPIEYKNRVRIQQAIDILVHSNASIEWISEYLNFSSPSYFRRVFKKWAGSNPSQFRKRTGLI